jgi:hypothetical protein
MMNTVLVGLTDMVEFTDVGRVPLVVAMVPVVAVVVAVVDDREVVLAGVMVWNVVRVGVGGGVLVLVGVRLAANENEVARVGVSSAEGVLRNADRLTS